MIRYSYPVDDYPGTWQDSTGYDVYYTAVGPAYHTGADLNNNSPRWDSDRGAPVRAVANGAVTFSGVLPGSWGQVIVIRHDDGAFSRSAHVADRRVKAGDRVTRGQQIANIGNADGKGNYHLHFDISLTDVLLRDPGHWPGLDRTAVRVHYVDPLKYITERVGVQEMGELAEQIVSDVRRLDEIRVTEKTAILAELEAARAVIAEKDKRIAELEAAQPAPPPVQWRVVNAPYGLNVRGEASISAPKVAALANGDVVEELERSADGVWIRHALGWTARVYNGVTYLVRL